MKNLRVVVLSGFCALAAFATAANAASVKVGDKAPEISAGTWMNLPDGMSKVSLKDLKGQIVIIDFWATW
ncbi:MAG: peroxiredoxin family protein [Phycisphaerales bacterium]|nr:peroxiredoxin family protein [Phycisphaerales bacterium]